MITDFIKGKLFATMNDLCQIINSYKVALWGVSSGLAYEGSIFIFSLKCLIMSEYNLSKFAAPAV